MAVIVINSGNQAEHILVKAPDGTQDTMTCQPGRSTLAEGWSVVDTGVSIRHLRVVDTSPAQVVEEVAAKQAATTQAELAALDKSKPAAKE